ncbi:hypothetical protein [Antarctobacter heliothermus]|uniref:Uncharacterized protein n=1 Tax=Antarctobacter heliothermus TaxID=74033 RepID=A0A239ARA0_9RHOB|nr:hypothetical protein [Antarctobacter heliothermus]SNR97528.1 hypothetical protein SAMN04488078_100151 [Antarctobacter heliothermus]
MDLAAGAFHDIVTQQFENWRMPLSEQDVAMLTLKGLTIPEVAQMRGNTDDTDKAHLGASGRIWARSTATPGSAGAARFLPCSSRS